MLWTHPDSADDWARGLEQPGDAAGDADDEVPEPAALDRPVPLAVAPVRARARRAAPSARSSSEVVRAADLLGRRGGAARARGLVVHACLETIEWLDFDIFDAFPSSSLP